MPFALDCLTTKQLVLPLALPFERFLLGHYYRKTERGFLAIRSAMDVGKRNGSFGNSEASAGNPTGNRKTLFVVDSPHCTYNYQAESVTMSIEATLRAHLTGLITRNNQMGIFFGGFACR